MQKYICENCDNLECDTSICPVCGKRTNLIRMEVYYCKHCNCPTFSDECDLCHGHSEKIGSDIRPVFAQERLLLEVLLDDPFKFAGSSVWCVGANNYIVDGKKIKLPFQELRKKNPKIIIEELLRWKEKNQNFVDSDFTNSFVLSFIKANANHLNVITDEALSYISDRASKFDISSMFVSFSGGKDSTVTSNLVMRALGTESILHIYGDTTLEYPESGIYIKEFRNKYPKTPVLVAKNEDQDFQDLCEVVGPPSRVMRWCCTIFKTGAITKKIEQVFKNKY